MTEPIKSIILPWMPVTDPHDLAVALKWMEELGEGISRMARCMMAGMEEPDPDTKRTNREELEREIADIYATSNKVHDQFGILTNHDRINRKLIGFQRWHNLIDEELAKKNGS